MQVTTLRNKNHGSNSAGEYDDGMARGPLERMFHQTGRALLIAGVLLLSFFFGAYMHRFIMVKVEMARFDDVRKATANKIPAAHSGEQGSAPARRVRPGQERKKNNDSWPVAQLKNYAHSFAQRTTPPLAVLRIAKLNLEVPVLEGTDDITLNRGVGHIRGTAFPGQQGNVGIAGHRDSFFRELREISRGDTIELVTLSNSRFYVVDQIAITTPDNVSALEPRPKPSLTLVTCYPFNYIGNAPKRYIVAASLRK